MIEHNGGGNSKLQRLFLILLGGVLVLVALEGLSMFKSDARCTIQQGRSVHIGSVNKIYSLHTNLPIFNDHHNFGLL